MWASGQYGLLQGSSVGAALVCVALSLGPPNCEEAFATLIAVAGIACALGLAATCRRRTLRCLFTPCVLVAISLFVQRTRDGYAVRKEHVACWDRQMALVDAILTHTVQHGRQSRGGGVDLRLLALDAAKDGCLLRELARRRLLGKHAEPSRGFALRVALGIDAGCVTLVHKSQIRCTSHGGATDNQRNQAALMGR